MTRFVFVSGTDTGVGKTLVSGGLACALVARGLRVVAVKPVETGCAGAPRPEEDGVRLARAAGQVAPEAALLRLLSPVTPAIAAEEEGVAIDIGDLARRIHAIAGSADVAIIEGAGGLLSPITWDHDFTHLVRALDGEAVVLVASNRLGVIHHVRAAAQCARDAGLRLDAVILSAGAEVDAADASRATNAAAVRRALARHDAGIPIVEVPRVTSFEEAATHLLGLADLLAAALAPHPPLARG